MRFQHKVLFLILSFLLTLALAEAQEAGKRSSTTELIDGQEYYIHIVESGQTLFAISRIYDVPVTEIISNNPGADQHIKPGDRIKVPKQAQEDQKQAEAPSGVNLRRVARGETLFSLSREYNVTIEEILAANDGLPDGLKEGEFIRIPRVDRPPATALEESSATQPSSQTMEPEPQTGAIEQQQTQTPSTLARPQETQTGKDYIEFQERNRETLYQLAIRYRISIDSIYALNPGISDQLSRGQIIKIPVSDVERNYITHTAQRRITVNRLARSYDIDLDKIRDINPYMSRQLQAGQTIRIPLPSVRVVDDPVADSLLVIEQKIREVTERTPTQREFCEKLMEEGHYNIALMVPFFLDEVVMRTGDETESNAVDEQGFIRSYLFVQFYEGFLLALDSLKQLGLHADVHVFNVEDDIEATQKVLSDPKMKEMDMIIGPFYNTSFLMTANFARQHQIPIINPLSTRSDILTANPFVYKVKPAENELFQTLVDYLNHRHTASQIFIARHNPFRDEIAFNQLKNKLNRELKTREFPLTSLYHEIVYTRDSVYTFQHQASTKNDNVVIIYSDNKVFTLDILRKLNQLRDTFDITVIGIPNWTEMEGFDYRHKNNLKTHVLATGYADYDDAVVKNFVRRFRDSYHAEPENYAFLGYDIGIYFLSALMKFGKHFSDCIPYYEMDALQTGFRFSAAEGGGFENRHWKVLRMRNFKYREVSTKLPVFKHPQQE
jgi:LysM repeat protein